MKFSSLPRPLIVLLFAWPVLAAPTTPNDPFRAIILKQPKPEQEQICCLIPPPLSEPQPTEDELLLSFEDWKTKLLAERSNSVTGSSGDSDTARHTFKTDPIHVVDGSDSGSHDGGEGRDGGTDPSLASHLVPSTSGQPLSQDQADLGFGESMLPHFRVPLTDRFNYASMECSARIHQAHKSAKSASSILSSKKDRYMLSPCITKAADGKAENHFVIVELCEDIRIDTVQLANFEFFSGVFKEFTLSVAKTYTPDVPEWTNVGTYRARNIRGVQSFHPPSSLRDFYRYIRIDFHSHYGSEFYCPVSLLRVYGLTHLEEWKWDSRANRYEQLQIPDHALPQKANPDPTPSALVDVVAETISVAETLGPFTEPFLKSGRVRTKTNDQSSIDSVPEHTSIPQDVRVDGSPPPSVDTESIPIPSYSPQSLSVVPHSPSDMPTSHSISDPTPQTTEVTSSVAARSSSPALPSQATPVISLGSQTVVPLPQGGSGGGESIYRKIMNKIAVLEMNATLHARYVEEHSTGVREMLKRLTEEIGRLEGIGKAQAQMYQRSLLEMERHQRRLELEHGELMSRVQYLAEEITMEKRLGIAQLCIMVAVLAFMALTRGSRGESIDHVLLPRVSRRNGTMSLSGEWMHRFRTGSTPTPPTQSPGGSVARRKSALSDEKIEFSSNVTQTVDRPERTKNRGQNSTHTAPNSLRKSGGRAKTPQSRTPKVVRVSTTPSLRPSIARANSQSHGHNWMDPSFSPSVIAPLPKSVKRWARTAHVHEIKRKVVDSGVSSQSEAEIETPNDSTSRTGWSGKGKQKEPESTTNPSFTIGGNDSRRGSFGRPPLRPTSSTNVNMLDTEATDPWVDTDDASEAEADVYLNGLNRTKGRFTKSTDALTIHPQPPQGLVGIVS